MQVTFLFYHLKIYYKVTNRVRGGQLQLSTVEAHTNQGDFSSMRQTETDAGNWVRIELPDTAELLPQETVCVETSWWRCMAGKALLKSSMNGLVRLLLLPLLLQ